VSSFFSKKIKNPYLSLGFNLVNALLVIFLFTFYVSVAQDIPFRKRLAEMACIGLTVGALTFCIGYDVDLFFHIELIIRLPGEVGRFRAKEVLMTRKFVSAEEAVRWGFVTKVVPHDTSMEATF
jgi:hypothetical protein